MNSSNVHWNDITSHLKMCDFMCPVWFPHVDILMYMWNKTITHKWNSHVKMYISYIEHFPHMWKRANSDFQSSCQIIAIVFNSREKIIISHSHNIISDVKNAPKCFYLIHMWKKTKKLISTIKGTHLFMFLLRSEDSEKWEDHLHTVCFGYLYIHSQATVGLA